MAIPMQGTPWGRRFPCRALDIYEEIDLIGHVQKVSKCFLERCYAMEENSAGG